MARKHLSRKLASMIAASAIIAAPTGIGATAVVSAQTAEAGAESAQHTEKPAHDPAPVKFEQLKGDADAKHTELTVKKDSENDELVVTIGGVAQGDWVAFSYFLDKEKDTEANSAPEHNVLSDEDEAADPKPTDTWWQAGKDGEIRLPKDKLPDEDKYTLVAQSTKDSEQDKVLGWLEVDPQHLDEIDPPADPTGTSTVTTPQTPAPGDNTSDEPSDTTTPTSTTTTESDGSVPDGTIEGTGKALMKMFGAIATFGQDANSTGSTKTTGTSTKSSKSTSTKSSTSKKSSNSTSNNSNSKEPQTSRSRTTSSGGSGSKSTSSGSKSSGSGSKSSKSSKSSGKSGKSTKSTKAKSTKSNKAKKSGSKPEKAAKNPVKTTDELKSANAHGVKGALEDDRLVLTVPEAKAGDWLYVYVFSDDKAPKGLGWMKVDKNKKISIDTSDLGPGVHKFALVNEDDKLVGWNGVQFPDEPGNGASEENVAPQAQSEVMMAASDWSLIAGSLGIVALSALGAFVWWRTRNLG